MACAPCTYSAFGPDGAAITVKERILVVTLQQFVRCKDFFHCRCRDMSKATTVVNSLSKYVIFSCDLTMSALLRDQGNDVFGVPSYHVRALISAVVRGSDIRARRQNPFTISTAHDCPFTRSSQELHAPACSELHAPHEFRLPQRGQGPCPSPTRARVLSRPRIRTLLDIGQHSTAREGI